MWKDRNISTFIACESTYTDADTVLFGAPFDGTTTFRPGTRFAAEVMRMESYGLETYSPYLDRDMEDYSIFDGGDLELAFGNKEKALETIEDAVKTILTDGKRPFMIGGEHLVSLPAIKACYEKYPDLHVIHFDAHTDLREDYMGEPLSHSSVIRRAWDFLGDGRINQFGIRSGLREEFKWAAEGHTNLTKFNLDGLKETVESLKGKPVYLTIDLDVLDPSVFPGTGTPEPGGISFHDLQEAIKMMETLDIIGLDVVELAPHYDQSGASTAVACKTVRELLLTIQK